jgi:hypothetical protein
VARGQKLNTDAAEPEERIGNGGDSVGNSPGPADAPPDKEDRPGNIPPAERPKSAPERARLVLVRAATYTAAVGGLAKIKKNVPFEIEKAAAKKLLEMGLFEEA